MNNKPTLLKLIALCAFLWVQATQADHFADQAIYADHVECLACKAIGDPIASGDTSPTFTTILFTSNRTTRVSLDIPALEKKQADPARAPPASA